MKTKLMLMLLILILLLSGCGAYDKGATSENISGYHRIYTITVDGVDCIVIDFGKGAGISCDWER